METEERQKIRTLAIERNAYRITRKLIRKPADSWHEQDKDRRTIHRLIVNRLLICLLCLVLHFFLAHPAIMSQDTNR